MRDPNEVFLGPPLGQMAGGATWPCLIAAAFHNS